MSTKQDGDGVYISYIKINGRPILPPLLDETTRTEMQHYRELAISVGLKIAERNSKSQVTPPSEIIEKCLDISNTLEPLEEQHEPISPSLTASTDLNQFLDSTLENSPPTEERSSRNYGRLIRSASYTLDQPSESLLAAVAEINIPRDVPCSALQEETIEQVEESPSKKYVVFKTKKKKVLPSKFNIKKSSPRTKIKRKSIIKKSNDDVHIDLDLHLDFPADFIAPCSSRLDHGYIQQEHLNYVQKMTQEHNISFYKPITHVENEEPDNENYNTQNEPENSNQGSVTPQNDLVPYEQLQNGETKDDPREQLESPELIDSVMHNTSTTDFSRPATTQTEPISLNDSLESLDQTLSPCNSINNENSTTDINLPDLMTNIQSEYELKLKELLKQQEVEKQRLKEEFFQQQEHLFQRLSISSPVLCLSKPHPPSPPIRTPRPEPPSATKPLSAVMMAKFYKLPAFVRGYLTRRLMKTERVQNIKATVRETLSLAVHLHGQPPPLHASDIALHGRLIQQLDQALIEFHDVFFSLPLSKRMALIAMDRDRLRRASSARSRSSGSGRVSSATQKAQQRRQQQQQELLTPRVNAKGDTPVTSRQCRLRGRSSSQRSLTGSMTSSQTNGDTLTPEPRAKKISERQANLTKNKRPWR